MRAKTSDTVTLQCELSETDLPVKWMHAGKLLISNDKYSLVAEGCVHKLTIRDLKADDAGVYSVKCTDTASKSKLCVDSE